MNKPLVDKITLDLTPIIADVLPSLLLGHQDIREIVKRTLEMATASTGGAQRDACTAPVSAWNYNMAKAPTGQRCLLLNAGGVTVIGPAPKNDATSFFRAWAPLPKRDKALEESLGINI